MSVKVAYSYCCDICNKWAAPLETILPIGVPYPQPDYRLVYGMHVCDTCRFQATERIDVVVTQLRQEVE